MNYVYLIQSDINDDSSIAAIAMNNLFHYFIEAKLKIAIISSYAFLRLL